MKSLVSTLILLIISNVTAQSDYSKNQHVSHSVKKKQGNYIVSYTFKDHEERICKITFTMDREGVDRDIKSFGIPQSMFEPYSIVPEVLEERKRILKKGLFKKKGNNLVVDKSAMVNQYSNYTSSIAEWMKDYLKNKNEDSRLNRIRLAMKFVQDIPYGIPREDRKWYNGGVYATPAILVNGYGDCDTKAILFVGILCHLIDPDDIRFAGEPGHVYTVIKAKPSVMRNLDSQKYYFKLNGRRFYVAETAGPGRWEFGEEGGYKHDRVEIEQVEFNR